jgi:nitrogen fixation protein FixH
MKTTPVRTFTGRHFAMIMVTFFGVIVTVNLVMARLAGATFGGVVVDNSYVASQHFNRWLDEAATERALGWSAEMRRAADGRLVVEVAGLSDGQRVLTAVARHPLGRTPDLVLAFERLQDGRFRSLSPLPAGRWRVRVTVQNAGRIWRSEGDIR